MPSMDHPIILLLGAQSEKNPLLRVAEELDSIEDIFQLNQSTIPSTDIKNKPYLNKASLKSILDNFSNEVAILHFATHSDQEKIQTDNELIHSKHIADIIKDWKIKPNLVFLNGCKNQNQVQLFLDAGVANVIATSCPIKDQDAKEFSTEFYSSLFTEGGNLPIENAFLRGGAKTFLDNEEDVKDFINTNNLKSIDWNWGLFYKNPDSSIKWTIKELIINNRVKLDKQGNLINPYMGLESFKEKDYLWFFGREHLANELTKKIEKTRLFTLLGASGSGKSSLINAGVITKLRQKVDVLIVKSRPGNQPFSELAKEITKSLYDDKHFDSEQVTQTKNLSEKLQKEDWTDHFDLILDKTNKNKIYLFIDQFEELYTQSDSLITKLYEKKLVSIINSEIDCTLVISMRADFLSSALANPGFGPLIDKYSHKLLAPMSKAELREVIIEPAKIQDIKIESSLVDALLSDLDSQPGYLPLLEYVLNLLWKNRDENILTLTDYNETGGLEEALETRANEIYNSFSDSEKETCKNIFLRLIQIGEGKEDTRRRADLRSEFGNYQDSKKVLKVLADERLITTHLDMRKESSFAEISHEALIKHWKLFRDWIEENRGDIRFHNQINNAAKDWDDNNNGEDWLFSGDRLLVSKTWFERNKRNTTDLERNFLTNSIEKNQEIKLKSEKIRKRNRNFVCFFLASFFLATIVLIKLYLGEKSALKSVNLNLAKVYETMALAALGKGDFLGELPKKESIYKLDEYQKSWLYAFKALTYDPEVLSDVTIAKLTNISSKAIAPFRSAIIDEVFEPFFNSNSTLLNDDSCYTAEEDMTCDDADDLACQTSEKPEFLISPDNEIKASIGCSITGRVLISKVNKLENEIGESSLILPKLGFGIDDSMEPITFSDNSKYISKSGEVWDVSTFELKQAISYRQKIDTYADQESMSNDGIHEQEELPFDLSFSPDGNLLAQLDDFGLAVRNAKTKRIIFEKKEVGSWWTDNIAFVSNTEITISSGNGLIEKYNINSSDETEKVSLDEIEKIVDIKDLEYSKLKETIVFQDEKGISTFNLVTKEIQRIIQLESIGAASLSFNMEADLLAYIDFTDSEIGVINIYNMTDKTIQVIPQYFSLSDDPPRNQGVVFTKKDHIAVARGNLIEIWNIKTFKLVRLLKGHIQPISSLAYNRFSDTLVSSSFDLTIRFWDLNHFATLDLFDNLDPKRVLDALMFLWRYYIDDTDGNFERAEWMTANPNSEYESERKVDPLFKNLELTPDNPYISLLSSKSLNETKIQQLVNLLKQQCAFRNKEKEKSCKKEKIK